MRRFGAEAVAIGGAAIIGFGSVYALAQAPAAKTQTTAPSAQRGEYLVNAMACDDCHTPWKMDPVLKVPVPDMTRRLSGHPANVPAPKTVPADGEFVIGATLTSFRAAYGTVYGVNLTPDPETGLGKWTEDIFVKAIRTGKLMGTGRPIMPPMPWPSLARLNDSDLRSVFLYLRTLPPVKNQVPAIDVPEPVLKQIATAHEQMKKMK